MTRTKLLVRLGGEEGEELELDTPVDTVRAEPLEGDPFLVVVESLEEASLLEDISALEVFGDAVWTTDVSDEDREYLESVSLPELQEKVKELL